MINFRIEVERCLKVLAFWVWLESQGCHEIMTNIFSSEDNLVTQVFNEANAFLPFLQPNSVAPLPVNFLQITATLARHCARPFSAIFADKAYVSRCITDIHKDVISSNFLKEVLQETKVNSGTKADNEPSTSKSVSSCTLNPAAKEWIPQKEKAAEEYRCLFLTFSNGYPISEHQITRFFNRKYGVHVERVYVHWPEPRNRRVPPLFGKVVFDASSIPAIILNGKSEAKFWVDGRPLWCKRFDPRKKEKSNN
ncbi:hypothetical protein Tsubulata_008240 [Turnera subulata]|uniref:Uncharacterized protein n=1 Tax=Turnera subulata TaxID=218843 RepID=A0A9Q0J441_9ROSI|nr:hypothetical protein Tsubulata_008240 [Turnera subulata]